MSQPSPFTAQGAQLRAKNALNGLDGELSKFTYAKEFERRTGVPKTYVALGVGSIAFIMIFFNVAGQFLTNLIAWLYPAYASFKAMETSSKSDDKQWLTYWTVVGFLHTIEYFSDILLYWFHFYYFFKTILVLYLALPQFRGAEALYFRFLRPLLLDSKPTTAGSPIKRAKSRINSAASSSSNKSE